MNAPPLDRDPSAPLPPSSPPSGLPSGPPQKLLRRCPHRRVLGGVAAGLAEYLDVDAGAVRIALVVFAFIGGVAIPLYLAAWLLIPEEESDISVAEGLFAPRPRHRY
jgi:phage shock protein PspC (stress-responsive transcriptional regulator)